MGTSFADILTFLKKTRCSLPERGTCSVYFWILFPFYVFCCVYHDQPKETNKQTKTRKKQNRLFHTNK